MSENNNKNCVYNSMINCDKHDKCDRCGFNPDVAKERIREWRAKQILEEENK